MKKVLVILLAAGAAYFAFAQYGGFGKPVYAEIRLQNTDLGVELLGLGMMNSESDCQSRASHFWSKVLASNTRFTLVSTKCTQQIPARFQGIFENRQYHATYVSFEKGGIGERDGRFVIYGVPSTEMGRFCPEFVRKAKENYSGKVECVLGSVG